MEVFYETQLVNHIDKRLQVQKILHLWGLRQFLHCWIAANKLEFSLYNSGNYFSCHTKGETLLEPLYLLWNPFFTFGIPNFNTKQPSSKVNFEFSKSTFLSGLKLLRTWWTTLWWPFSPFTTGTCFWSNFRLISFTNLKNNWI